MEQRGIGYGQAIKSSTAIMTGNRLTLHYIREQREDTVTKILFTEKDWVKLEFGVPTPATKEDFMKVLSDIQVIIYLERAVACVSHVLINVIRYSTYGQLPGQK